MKKDIDDSIAELSSQLNWDNLKHADKDTVDRLHDLQEKLPRQVSKVASKLDVEGKSSPQARAARKVLHCWKYDMNGMVIAMAELEQATTIE